MGFTANQTQKKWCTEKKSEKVIETEGRAEIRAKTQQCNIGSVRETNVMSHMNKREF